MTAEVTLVGGGVSAGVAVGPAFLPVEPEAHEELDGAAALRALERVGADLGRTAARLRTRGRTAEAEIIEANQLMATDPSLAADVAELAAILPAARALDRAIERQVDLLLALDDPLLSARAADVRELGRRAIRALAGTIAAEPPAEPSVIVARDVGPAELIDLGLEDGLVLGVALADGAATSHAAIMARALGIPLVVGLGESVLETAPGAATVVDGSSGVVVLEPSPATAERARAQVAADAERHAALASLRGLPPVTRDGRHVRLLANAATPVESAAALSAGAEGLGLVRTEFSFLHATDWPSATEHADALAATLAPFEGRVVTVRTLDYGADKTPGFLHGRGGRGIALMLEHEDALRAQFEGILRAAGSGLRIMLPLVESPVQVVSSRRLLAEAATTVGVRRPPLGAMIETPAAVRVAPELALVSEFFSIGTNDLVAATLGLDRQADDVSALRAAEPAVLHQIRDTVAAAHTRGIGVEICGEAAGEVELVPVLIGLGVDELSVAPSRLDAVRAAIRESGEAADEARELHDGARGVVA